MKKLLCSSIFLASSGIFAAAITNVTTVNGMSGTYDIVFKNANVQPNSFNTRQPASIVLDFPDTSASRSLRKVELNQNGISSVNVIPGEGRTRAVINLDAATTYKIRRIGKDVYVSIPSKSTAGNVTQSAQLPKPALAQSKSKLPSSVAVRVPLNGQSIKPSGQATKQSVFELAPMFHRNGEDGGILSFTLPDKDTQVSVKKEGNALVLTLADYVISKNAQRRLDVADYNSPVRYVDIVGERNQTQIRMNMGNSGYDYQKHQKGRTYSVEVSTPRLTELDKKTKELTGFGADKVYAGAPLSLNFQDIEVRAVIQIIAEFIDQNIVLSDTVKGNITLRLDNVPWDQALEIIMKTKGLAMRKSGSVIYIAPEKELNQSEIAALTDWQQKQQLMPSHTELIQVKYAKASDLVQIIQKSKGSVKDWRSMQDSILSAKGSIGVDERTNTLLVSDIPSKIQAVRDLVYKLDEPVRQVLIDARMVKTSDNYAREIGARFGLTFNGNSGNTSWGGSGSLDASSSAARGNALSSIGLGDRLGVSLPSEAKGGSYGVSLLGKEVLVDLELQAMQSEGRTEVISSPRVVTQDGYKALVSAGQEIPYSTQSDGGTSTAFKSAKLSLEVTPRIAPNDRVSMDIHITKDLANFKSLVGSEPSIDTNEINTRVEIDNGATIVLGGIYEQTQGSNTSKVPLLGDIPVIGNIFKTTAKSFRKDELLVFITPRIINKRFTDNDKFSNLRD